MKRIFPAAVALATIIIFGLSDASACTSFFLKAKDGSVVSARTDEFFSETHSKLELVPRGTAFTSTAPKNATALSWKTRYGFIAISMAEKALGTGFDEGMNEKGLASGGLWFGDVKYPAIEPGDEAINVLDVIGWVLGNFQSVAEVKEALPKVKLWASDNNIFHIALPMHFYVTDATGDSIVVESIDGTLKIWDNRANGVMTNEPDLGWQLNNLRFFSNMNPHASPFPKRDNDTWSLGTGLLGMPGDYTDAARFVRISKLKQFSIQPKDAAAAVVLAQHLINNVDIPYGPQLWIQGGRGFPQWTVWTVIYDQTHRYFYYRTYDNPLLRRFELGRLDFSEGQPRRSIAIFGGDGFVDDTGRWLAPGK